jgi:hypothetical protein
VESASAAGLAAGRAALAVVMARRAEVATTAACSLRHVRRRAALAATEDGHVEVAAAAALPSAAGGAAMVGVGNRRWVWRPPAPAGQFHGRRRQWSGFSDLQGCDLRQGGQRRIVGGCWVDRTKFRGRVWSPWPLPR